MVRRGKLDAVNTQIRDRSLSWLGTGTAVKCDGVKPVLWAQTPLPPHVAKCDSYRIYNLGIYFMKGAFISNMNENNRVKDYGHGTYNVTFNNSSVISLNNKQLIN